MTYRQFKTFVSKVSHETLQTQQNHPILFALERLRFEKLKLQRLIEAGNRVECKTVQRRVQAWEREKARLETKKKYLKERYQEVFHARAIVPPRAEPSRR